MTDTANSDQLSPLKRAILELREMRAKLAQVEQAGSDCPVAAAPAPGDAGRVAEVATYRCHRHGGIVALQHMRGSLKGCGNRVLQRVIVGAEGVAPHVGSPP